MAARVARLQPDLLLTTPTSTQAHSTRCVAHHASTQTPSTRYAAPTSPAQRHGPHTRTGGLNLDSSCRASSLGHRMARKKGWRRTASLPPAPLPRRRAGSRMSSDFSRFWWVGRGGWVGVLDGGRGAGAAAQAAQGVTHEQRLEQVLVVEGLAVGGWVW